MTSTVQQPAIPKTMPPDLAGAMMIYLEAKRKYSQAWEGEHRIKSRHVRALREESEAAAAVLLILERHFSGESQR
jgi:hypothetical protein